MGKNGRSAGLDEIRHELAYCYREIDRSYQAVHLARRRLEASAKRERVAEADFEAGRSNVDLVLRAQAVFADANRRHLQSLLSYNKAIVELKHREGMMLSKHHIAIDGRSY